MQKSTTSAMTGQVWPAPGQVIPGQVMPGQANSAEEKQVDTALNGAPPKTAPPKTAPWSFALKDAQWGVVSINLGAAGDPESERRIVQQAGSYGRQIGWVSEALEVVVEALRALPNGPLSRDRLDDEEIVKLDKFAELLTKVEDVKRRLPLAG